MARVACGRSLASVSVMTSRLKARTNSANTVTMERMMLVLSCWFRSSSGWIWRGDRTVVSRLCIVLNRIRQ